MQTPNGSYYYSTQTLEKAQKYLTILQKNPDLAGQYLKNSFKGNYQELSPEVLIAHLMNTRRPRIFAESAPILNGSDWNQKETSILGDISFATFGTKAFNNGGHQRSFKIHEHPLPVNLIYASSALLANGHDTQTSDMIDVIDENGAINEDNLYQLYERRLLPGLIAQNEQAIKDNKFLVINIPGMGCGQFAGAHETQVRTLLPQVLITLFRNYAHILDRVHTVYYDPYLTNGVQKKDVEIASRIRFMIRPYQALQPTEVASQLEFPKDGYAYNENFQLVKVVAWDHFSYPGNDMWADSRATDDGVTFASTDTFLAMTNSGQFGSVQSAFSLSYDTTRGSVMVPDVYFSELAESLNSNVLPEHLKCLETRFGFVKHGITDLDYSSSNSRNSSSEKSYSPFMHAIIKLNKELETNLNVISSISSSEETKLVITGLLSDLNQITHRCSDDEVIHQIHQLIEEIRPSLQQDLPVLDCIGNFLKKLVRCFLLFIPCMDSNNFFKPARTPACEIVDDFADELEALPNSERSNTF